jgi:hypothetical protein
MQITNEDKFFEWWNGDEIVENLNIRKNSALYWAVQGWEAALRAKLSEPEPEQINYEEWKYNPMTGEVLWNEQPEPDPVAWHKCERCGEVNPADIHTCTPIENLTSEKIIQISDNND